jgi:hypothetical protein
MSENISKQEQKELAASKFAAGLSYIRSKYVPCTGRDFDLALNVEQLSEELYKELDHWYTTQEIKLLLSDLMFNLKQVGDKRIAYARRVSVL